MVKSREDKAALVLKRAFDVIVFLEFCARRVLLVNWLIGWRICVESNVWTCLWTVDFEEWLGLGGERRKKESVVASHG